MEGTNFNLDELFSNLGTEKFIQLVLEKAYRDQGLNAKQLLNLYQKSTEEIFLPLSLFTKQNTNQLIYAYLYENKNLSFAKISKLTGRDIKSIWTSYNKISKNKKREKDYLDVGSNYSIPLSLFKDRDLSVLEHVIFFLWQTYGLSSKNIAKVLQKSQSNISVLLKRAKDKKKTTKEVRL